MLRHAIALSLVLMTFSALLLAELPPLDAESKAKLATHAVTGKVVRVYAAEEDRGKGMVNTAYAIEIVVEGVTKGEGVAKGRTIFVKTWKAKRRPAGWVGPSGQYEIPKAGDAVSVHMKEGDDGYTALIPNGIETVKP